MVVPDPLKTYPSQDVIWERFGTIFKILEGLVDYVGAFKAYYLQGLNEFYEDGVQYLEIRCLLPEVLDLSLEFEI